VELDELRQQLATLQLQTKRLASVFKGKIEEFRKASNPCQLRVAANFADLLFP
jgi:hypothetical protein